MAKATVSLGGRDILDLDSLSVEEYELILKTAAEMKRIMKRDIKKVPSLRGKSIINLFYEPSTRTRTSFELAGKYLGADVVNITTSSSSVVKGECLRDTILTVQSMACDAIVMRHPIEGAAAYAADVSKAVIINAGDGAHAHPSQGVRMPILRRAFWICLLSASRARILKASKWRLSAIFYTAVLRAPTLPHGRSWAPMCMLQAR